MGRITSALALGLVLALGACGDGQASAEQVAACKSAIAEQVRAAFATGATPSGEPDACKPLTVEQKSHLLDGAESTSSAS